jgi:glucokinase
VTTILENPRLVCDVGGTWTRFALADNEDILHNLREFKTDEFSGFVDAAESYFVQRDANLPRPKSAAVAVAGPVNDGIAELTNADWTIEIEQTKAALGLTSLWLVNDFEAQAHALPWLGSEDLQQIGGGQIRMNENRVVLGPGTGLGVAGLVSDRFGRVIAVPGEGGHVTLAAMNDDEADLIARLRNRFGHVSAERVVSGPGLEALYLVLRERDGDYGVVDPPTAAKVAAYAASGDEVASKAIRYMSSFLGTVAADLALIFWARGGVYLSGGVLRRIGSSFDKALFRQRFETKGRFSHELARFPTFFVTRSNLGLLGLTKIGRHQRYWEDLEPGS